MLGDYQFYKDRRSPVANLFEISAHARASNLTSIRVLMCLDRVKDTAHAEGIGFMGLDSLLQSFEEIFGSSADAAFHLERLIERRLAEADSRQTRGLVGATAVRITRGGTYYLRTLVGRFVYLDLVALDTPMWHHKCVTALSSRAKEADLYARFRRVEWFLAYLSLEEKRSLKTVPRSLAEKCFTTNIVKQRVEKMYRSDQQRVIKNASLSVRRAAEIRAEVIEHFEEHEDV